MESALPVSRVKPSSKERDKVCMKKNDEELFALIKEKLYTPGVGDILDQMGYCHQFLPAYIKPLESLVPSDAYIDRTEEFKLATNVHLHDALQPSSPLPPPSFSVSKFSKVTASLSGKVSKTTLKLQRLTERAFRVQCVIRSGSKEKLVRRQGNRDQSTHKLHKSRYQDNQRRAGRTGSPFAVLLLIV